MSDESLDCDESDESLDAEESDVSRDGDDSVSLSGDKVDEAVESDDDELGTSLLGVGDEPPSSATATPPNARRAEAARAATRGFFMLYSSHSLPIVLLTPLFVLRFGDS